MTLSKTSQYAVRAALYLARQNDRVRASDIAEDLDVPTNYLSKILHILGRNEILDSERGPHGGFRLARPPEEITLAEVVGAFDEMTPDQRCLLGRSRCRDHDPCPAHERWKEVSERVYGFFEETKLTDLLGPEAPALDTSPEQGGEIGAASR
ncbi:MAG: Rrf2 family transcriptional regulator [Gemmatimonadota bacterium]|nr:Rrf2 family transcriptional regulator [Gemmatimonadota bacterium]